MKMVMYAMSKVAIPPLRRLAALELGEEVKALEPVATKANPAVTKI